MRIWIVMGYEPLPGIDADARLLRCGLLARALSDAHHDVVWWTGTFDHARKRHRFTADHSVLAEPHLRINLLYGPAYRRNVSFGRVLYHREVARRFTTRAARHTRPDIIFAVVPTLELAEAAIQYGGRQGVPVIVDAQDKWPDLYLDVIPRPLRPLVRRLLTSQFRRAREVFAGASGLTAVSDSYLDWALGYANRRRAEGDAIFPLGYSDDHLDEQVLNEDVSRVAQSLGIRRDALVVTYLGQFGSSYDLETVVAAARRLAQEGIRDVQFVLAGDGDKMPMLRRLADGLDNVVFAGWVDHRTGAAILRNSSVGLAAYTAAAPQSLPYKPFDYMGAGLPIISSLGGELERLLREEGTGVRYIGGNVDSLVEVIGRLRASPSEVAAMRLRMLRMRGRYSSKSIYPAFAQFLAAHTTRPRAATPNSRQQPVPNGKRRVT